jgi:hypothetical protein
MGAMSLHVRTRVAGAVLLIVSAIGATAPGADGEPGSTPAAAPIQGVDSMWVWHDPPADELAADATDLGVHRVFLFVGNRDRAADRRIKQSVALLHGEGVAVYALSGQPGWTLHHQGALRWADRALRLAPFDGLHLDVEPQAIKGWKKQQQQTLAADYLGLLDELGPLPGPLEVDVQFAYGKVVLGDGTDFADDILARVDAVTVMSYRDTADGPNGMIAIAEDWLQRADTADRPIWLAAETNAVPGCPYCTFYADGQADMAAVLGDVDSVERGSHPAYQGIAIEDLDGWLALGP